jgi:hypothetical protein
VNSNQLKKFDFRPNDFCEFHLWNLFSRVVLGSILVVIIKLIVITCCLKQRKEARRRDRVGKGNNFLLGASTVVVDEIYSLVVDEI